MKALYGDFFKCQNEFSGICITEISSKKQELREIIYENRVNKMITWLWAIHTHLQNIA